MILRCLSITALWFLVGRCLGPLSAGGDPNPTNSLSSLGQSQIRPQSESEEAGTIDFTNDYPSPYLWGKAYITSCGLPASKENHLIQLLDARDNSTLVGPEGLTTDGIVSRHLVRIPGTKPGESVNVVLRVWETGGRGTYEDALNRATIRITLIAGGGTSPPAILSPVFIGMDICGAWQGPGFPFPPMASRALDIQPEEKGKMRLSAICPEGWRFPYMVATSTDMIHWTLVGGSTPVPIRVDPLIEWILPDPKSDTQFYIVLP